MIHGWKEEIQRDYLEFLRKHGKASMPELAAYLEASEGSVVYWLTDLAREGKVRIVSVELVEEGERAHFLAPERPGLLQCLAPRRNGSASADAPAGDPDGGPMARHRPPVQNDTLGVPKDHLGPPILVTRCSKQPVDHPPRPS